MDEKTTSSSLSTEPTDSVSTTEKAATVQASGSSSTRAASEQRQAYGTAKTENLRDSGLWRLILPAVVITCCLALFVIPLLILIPLLTNSITALSSHSQDAQLLWVWISMIVIEVGAAIVITRGILKIFMTQAGNYQR